MDRTEAQALAQAELREARSLGYERLQQDAPRPAAGSEQLPWPLRRWVTRLHPLPGHRRHKCVRGASGTDYQVVREIDWDEEIGSTLRIWILVDDVESASHPEVANDLVHPPMHRERQSQNERRPRTSEARQLVDERMREISAMPLDVLVDLIEHPVEVDVEGPSGRSYRSKTYAFWDMESYESELFVRVEIRGRGLRSYQRYVGVETRQPDDSNADPPEDVHVHSAWGENLAWATCGLLVLALLVPWLLGIRYLLSRFL